jgi:hypothetical protein
MPIEPTDPFISLAELSEAYPFRSLNSPRPTELGLRVLAR